MALTETTALPLGFIAPDFDLIDVRTGNTTSLADVVKPKGLVVMFICNHCPYVVHVIDKLVEIGRRYENSNVGFVAISSNDVVGYPQDGPEFMKEYALELEFPFPYLYDESQEVAKAYDAACTPDFSVFDADLKCVYRGRLDDSTPGNGKPVTGLDLIGSIESLIAGDAQTSIQHPSMGCNIKWK